MSEHTPAPTPSRAIYGFALYLLFKSLFITYVVWVFVPEDFMHTKLGLTYLPDKYFALYIPILVLCAVTFFAFFIYPSLSLSMTADIDHVSTIRDKFSIKRCEYAGHNGRICDQMVTNGDIKSSWKRDKYCNYHSEEVQDDNKLRNVESNIKDFCDCQDEERCLLHTNKDYLTNLRQRKMVPNVSDLDISDVCKILYGR
jgi:phosphatidylinositol N-acetylglucosaminyltransferase subunit P